MKKYLYGAILVVLGIVIAFPLFSMTYYTMVRTSTPHFCASCHEIQPAYNDWKVSTHTNNARGVVVDCMDCHLPAPHDTFNFFFAKTWHGAKDVYAHFTEGPEGYDRAKNRAAAYRNIKNDQCQKCHRNILYIPAKRGAMLAHRSVLYPRPGYDKQCTDCHRNLVHVRRPFYSYLQCSQQ
ncbi:NapC/NirT family cytochrome c [Desulfoferrobacter suflitae]|uniref:NapC/NirT family cytochrome c n=1 Tax=Desulfoferrobacter suflitae TaxID=2865782 RepID=UPI002164DCD8|nr:NapC/NirT family cytochrome c [Desulfoferrobacter suflitae]MCK8601269.1 NapC/NirT family cytochrome c [Desulfoferrobacter suflitae]